MFHGLLDFISGSPWTYAVVLVLVAVDAFFPVLPGETSIITASILAGQGDLRIALVWLSTFVGVVAGDNITYFLGQTLGRRAADRFFRGEKSLKWLDWARRQLQVRSKALIIGGRFIPGARTAIMFAAGTLNMKWRRFISADLPGAALFTTVYTMLGYLGAEVFQHSIWLPLVVAVIIAGLITVGGEVYRRFWLDQDSE